MKSVDRRVFRPMSILTAVLVVVSCSQRPDRVTIGVALSGRVYPGVELAADEINRNGGIRGVRIDLEGPVVESNTDDFFARDAIAWAKKFAANQNLIAVIGNSESATTLASAPIYNQLGVVQIVTTATVTESASQLNIDLRGSLLWNPTDSSVKAAEFRRRFAARYRRPSNYLDAYAYDAMYLLREALLDGNLTREGIKTELDRLIEINHVFDGVTGRYSLGKTMTASKR